MCIKKILVLILCFTFVFTSCKKNNEVDDEENNSVKPKKVSQEQQKEPEEVIEKKEILYARTIDETDAINDVISEYNANSKEYKVVYHELPSSSDMHYSQLVMDFLDSTVNYDVIEIDTARVAEFAEMELVVPLDEFIERDKIDLSKYLSSIANSTKYKNKVWAMPTELFVGILYFRTDIINTPPATWDELVDLSKSLKGREGTKSGYIFAGKISNSFVLEALEMISSYGGNLMDINGNINIDVENTKLALEKMYEIYKSDIVPKKINMITNSEAERLFVNGESVFLNGQTHLKQQANKAGSSVRSKFAIAQLPKGSENGETFVSGRSALITSSSENQEGAWDFIKFLSGYEGQKRIAVNGGKVSVLTEVLSDNAVLEVNSYMNSDEFKNVLKNSKAIPATPLYYKYMEVFENNLATYFYDEQDIDETLSNIVREFTLVSSRAR